MLRRCLCGCGETFEVDRHRGQKKYFSDSCRAKFNEKRELEKRQRTEVQTVHRAVVTLVEYDDNGINQRRVRSLIPMVRYGIFGL